MREYNIVKAKLIKCKISLIEYNEYFDNEEFFKNLIIDYNSNKQDQKIISLRFSSVNKAEKQYEELIHIGEKFIKKEIPIDFSI